MSTTPLRTRKTKSFTLPADVIEAIEARSADGFAGNESAYIEHCVRTELASRSGVDRETAHRQQAVKILEADTPVVHLDGGLVFCPAVPCLAVFWSRIPECPVETISRLVLESAHRGVEKAWLVVPAGLSVLDSRMFERLSKQLAIDAEVVTADTITRRLRALKEISDLRRSAHQGCLASSSPTSQLLPL